MDSTVVQWVTYYRVAHLGPDLFSGIPLSECGSIILEAVKVHSDPVRYSQLVCTSVLPPNASATALVHSVWYAITSETTG